MKNIIFKPLLILLSLSIVLISCSDDKSSPNDTPKITAAEGKIVAKIGGTSFEGTGAAQIKDGEIIVGGNSGQQSLSIFVTKAAVAGTYDVKGAPAGTTPDAEVNYAKNANTLYSSVFAASGDKVGTVTIVEVNETAKTMSGTFSSKVLLTDGTSLEVTEGSFNKIPYSTVAASTLTAKVDGQDFTASVALGVKASGVIALNGQTVNGSKIITLSFADNITAGTYAIGELGDDAYATYTVSLASFLSTTGSLTITKHDVSLKRVEGKFSFKSSSIDGSGATHNITEGNFAVSY